MTEWKSGDSLPSRLLRLGDVIETYEGMPFSTAVVIKVNENTVTLFRPYAITADFSYTGGVLAYVGIETYQIMRSESMVKVYERKELK